jgi:uncharacterized membrane protein
MNAQHEQILTTWHEKHKETLTMPDRIADNIALGMGSWKFIIWQTTIVIIWMILNTIAYFYHWDPFPFILLNLLFSTQAAYAAPLILMSQNRQSARDRIQALEDYITNIEAKQEIEALQLHLSKIESEKLDKIIRQLQEIRQNQ